ncbi:class A sortase [Weissella confusa]|uniref:class A sortase n=1 Tax=Weissella confusa TaxID=1583 RepID=UPI0007056091|nr:class A sortase [Weissella confusa]KRN22176.1 sortase [Weissella confusa]MBJ7699500.1 class A sortase [Weissella confusa]MBS7551687.1 class A sortase [Weissella confusa]MCQ8097465.1 class A sortase [Weissella confusa]MCQ8146951.1 class A sortase [Weissella confusa]
MSEKKKKKKFAWLKWLGVLLILIISLGLIFHNEIANFTLKSFEPQVTKQSIKAGQKEKKQANYDWQKVGALTAQQVLQARLNSDKINFIGFVAVPEVGISVPISNGTTDLNLSLGAGTMFPDEVMGEGNYALASHFIPGDSGRDLLFSPLYYKGKVGQDIYLTDMNKVYRYKAVDFKVIQPTDVDWVYPVEGKKLVTLITCDYTAKRGRIMMRGELQGVKTWAETPKDIQKAFTTDNRWIK